MVFKMAMFKTFEEGVEVNGQTINSVSDAFSSLKFMVDKYFTQAGLPKSNEIDPNGWYSQQKWLNAFRHISEKVGSMTMLNIGKKIPENAQFPPEINNIVAGLHSIDVAYHMNHRNSRGQVLFDNGQIHEGIGHYEVKSVEGDPNKGQATLVCENPYHCDFDKGIITTMALKFNNGAKVLHDDSQGCRKSGHSSCHYKVEWS